MSAPASPREGMPAITVLLVGAGKMGGAMLRGWLDNGLPPAGVTVVDQNPSEELRALAAARGFALRETVEAKAAPDVLILAIKPQGLAGAAPELATLDLSRAVVISVLAGKTVADLSRLLGAPAVIRAMPNTPAAIRRGITGVFANEAVTETQRAAAHDLLAAVGQVEWLERESQIDAVTAVSGSGPAYVFFLTECLAEAAGTLGFEPALAARLARATVEGAAALMAAEGSTEPAELRRNVTSPGGTTAAALAVLGQDDALRALLVKAMVAARDRAVELAG